ncbi:MAG: hypothetical protein ACYDHN_02670 [Solirubrobacteraceae bacterium]
MLRTRRISVLSVSLVAFLTLISSAALATSIPVHLRIEGSKATLYEGDITTEAETIETPSSNGPHPCDYSENGNAGGFASGGNASATPTTAVHDAALAAGLTFDADWFGSGETGNENPGDFFVSQIGSDINQSSSPFDSWGFAVNDTTSPVGGCQVALAPGNEVLWAYNYFNLSHLLALSGPATAAVGVPVSVHVTDAQTGVALSGAAIGEVAGGITTTIPGSSNTDSGGNATVVLSHAGTVKLKATRSDSVRSNSLSICVHNGNDGTCGTTVPGTSSSTGTSNGSAPTNAPSTVPADVAKVAGIQSGHVYPRNRSPHVLRGVVSVPVGATLRQVRISLTRQVGGRCFRFDGRRERFVRSRCNTVSFFSVGGSESFSYLLPAALPLGRYVYDIETVDSAGKVTKPAAGISHVVFRVR